MTYPLPGVIVDPNGISTSITITSKTSGQTPTVYSDNAGQNVVSMPKTISAPYTFYLPGAGIWTVGGVDVTLADDEVATVNLNTGTGAYGSLPSGNPTAAAQSVVVTTAGTSPKSVWASPSSCRYHLLQFSPHLDGRQVSDGAMTSGSSTITSNTAAFTAADVGKLLVISGGGYSLTGTVSAYVSATSITASFSNNTGQAFSSAFVALGSDESTAFQEALDTMDADPQGGLCFVPDVVPSGSGQTGVYMIGVAQGTDNNQLRFPNSRAWGSTSDPVKTVGFVGQTPPAGFASSFNTSGPNPSGPVLLSAVKIAAPSNGYLLGSSSAPGNTLVATVAVLDNITLRNPSGSTQGGAALANLSGMDIGYLRVDVLDSDVTVAEPSQLYGAYAFMPPGKDNQALVRAQRIDILGYALGMATTEHLTVQELSICDCIFGLVGMDANHAAHITNAGIQNVNVPLLGSQGATACYLYIDEISIEESGDAQAPTWTGIWFDVLDLNNVLYGEVNIHRVLGSVGPVGVGQNGKGVGMFVKGAKNLNVRQIAGLGPRTVSVSASAAALDGQTVLANATSAALTVTLPFLPTPNSRVTIRKTDTSANAVTVQGSAPPQAAPTISSITTSTTGGSISAGTYYYVVTAVGTDGESLSSNEVSITTTGSTSTVTLSWSAPSGAISYNLYRSTTSGGETADGTFVFNTNSNSNQTDVNGTVGSIQPWGSPPLAVTEINGASTATITAQGTNTYVSDGIAWYSL